MDSPDLDELRHEGALRALARINLLSLAARRIWAGLRGLSPPADGPLKFLDVACGGGDVALWLKSRAIREGMAVEVSGCDLSPVAVSYAKRRARDRGLEVEFFHHDATAGELPGGFDVVSSSLFLHHLSRDGAMRFFAHMARAGKVVLIQDLLRTRLGYVMAWTAVRAVTRSRVVWVDGPRSVQAAFSLTEVGELAGEAGLAGARIQPCWPERFTLTWERA